MTRGSKILVLATTLLLLLTLTLIATSCGGEKVSPTPTPTATQRATVTPTATPRITPSPTPVATPTPTARATATPTATPQPTATPEAPPANFTTFTEAGLFSIAYPGDWVTFPDYGTEAEYSRSVARDVLSSSDRLPDFLLVFQKGIPSNGGQDPNILILVTDAPENISLEVVVGFQMEDIKANIPDFREFSREKVVVGGVEAVIVDFQGTDPEIGLTRVVQMYLIKGKIFWLVNAFTSAEKFSAVEDTAHQILRSFRILY